ncbi:capsular biosynthesis protein [Burkholderia cepacia]|uniref:capsular polysaccharide export protein, LipB/KpsS family n=1 Tax=Burkholderia TaxID=32008 RepID=UPI000398E5C2|nr:MULTISPECIES: capsule polysaccharide export protein [Burkholderia]HDR9762215.1 capsular biosynthesis protein [Burkholderia cepacia ATCC 25416]ERJ39535.1 Capsule polysaccharide export protein [Burkholderia sp. AU4i]KVH69680.1 capsular biosynthesis protein [Burkholderia cepacia]KVL24001.1 capsular biosynthesis protein [Burkholderia cepacia]KVQ27700.1 capsular biosynthesis protein [Burkholderia cepacia]
MILIVIDSLERYTFATRLVNAVRHEYEFAFLTSEPVAHLGLLLGGYRSVYLNRLMPIDVPDGQAADRTPYQLSIEVLNGQMTEARAKRESAAIFHIASEVLRGLRVEQCVMWNGQQLVCRAVRQACTVYGVATRFIEISNLPGKLFVDSLGVNALSTISRNPEAIDRLPLPDEHTHARWLSAYERYKQMPLPQARTSFARKAMSAANYVLKVLSRGVGRRRLASVRARNGMPAPRQATYMPADTLAANRYVFLPLQVSGDTQIKLHSDVDNLEAIRHAFEFAANESADLFVKLHPAETDAAEIEAIVRLQETYHFEIVTSPTTDLLRHAYAVVTINSTVGLEAMLYGKRVVSLGRCFYKEFDRERLLKYIHSFLVDGIDYFGAARIPADAARRVFATRH